MTAQECKNIFIEYAMNCLKAECMSFCNFYNLKEVYIDYAMLEDSANAYLYDKDDRIFIGNFTFADAALATRNPGPWIEEPFNNLVKKYDLQPPQPELVVIPDEEVTEEMKEAKAVND